MTTRKTRSKKPTPKVVAGAVGAGTVTAVLAVFGVEVSPALAALLATVASAGLAYAKAP